MIKDFTSPVYDKFAIFEDNRAKKSILGLRFKVDKKYYQVKLREREREKESGKENQTLTLCCLHLQECRQSSAIEVLSNLRKDN